MTKKYGIGMAGCMIVVVALLGSVLAGFCLDVSKQTRPVTDYEYVTDVTGLFDIDQAPAYIGYSPSTNYTGYADITSMQYSISSTPNNYRIMLDPGPTQTVSKSWNSITGYVDIEEHFAYATGNVSSIMNPAQPIETGNYTSSQLTNVYLDGGKTLTHVLTSLGVSDKIVTLTHSGNDWIYPVSSKSSYTISYYGGGSEVHQIWTLYDRNYFWDEVRYNPVSTIAEVYYNGNLLWYESSDNIIISTTYQYKSSGYLSYTDYYNGINDTFTASYIGLPVYSYINPAEGVALNNNTSTTWSNGYHNNEVGMTVSRTTVGSNNLTVQVVGATGSNSSIQINTSATGNMNVVVTDATGTSTTKVLGRWDSAQVSIDASAQTVSVTPIVGTPSYTEPISANGTTITFPNWWTGGDIDSLRLSTSGTSLRFGITDTWVFLDTYQSVMTNPSITIGDYFPDLTDWRLNFYSFALTGTSITVNGETYSVNSDQTVTIGTGDDAVTGSLSNVYVSKIDGEMFFTFADTGLTVDLGSAVSDTITFNGRWYYTTGLYDAVPGIEEYFDWNLDGGWHATNGQILMVFLGLLAFGTIIVKGVARIPMRATDILVVGFAALVSILIGGIIV